MLVLFPFESAFYEAEGVPATFVGHPAAQARPRAARAELLPRIGLDEGRPVVALLPGSRVGEAGRLFPILTEAARELRRTHPAAQFMVPRARTIPQGFLESLAVRAGAPWIGTCEADYPG